MQWVSCQIRKIAGCACAGNAGNVSPPPKVSDPDMHHGTCVTHVPWCTQGSLTNRFLWIRWRGKRSRHSQRMHNPQFYVSAKRSIAKSWQWAMAIWIEMCRNWTTTVEHTSDNVILAWDYFQYLQQTHQERQWIVTHVYIYTYILFVLKLTKRFYYNCLKIENRCFVWLKNNGKHMI